MVIHLCCNDCICFKENTLLKSKVDKNPHTTLANTTIVGTSDISKNIYVSKQYERTWNNSRNQTCKQVENCVLLTTLASHYFPINMACSKPLNSYFTRLAQGPITPVESMQYDTVRLSSYHNFPKEITVSALHLCNEGFFYVGTGDEIQCYSCHFKINDWVGKKDPFFLHKTNSPNCQFLLNKNGNMPLQNISNTGINVPNHNGPNPGSNIFNVPNTNNEEIPVGMDIGPIYSNYETRLTHDFNRLNTTEQTQHTNFNPSSGAIEQSDAVSEDNHGQDAQSATIFERQNQSTTFFPSDSGTLPNNAVNTDFRYESARLATFQNWPNNAVVQPEDLARSGFYYTGSADRVQCTFCRGILKNWEPGDQPEAEHWRHFEQCPFLRNPHSVGNVAISGSRQQRPATSPVNEIMIPGLVTEKPVYQRYSLPSERLATFKDFPSNMMQTKEQFSKAGFFYTGVSDQMKCFFCDGGLRNWDPEDEPWVEHARWFPKCGYLRLCKGEDFIKEVQNKYTGAVPEHQKRKFPKRSNKPVDNTKVSEYMRHPMVLSVLEMGYDVDKVRQVVVYRIQDFGTDFFPNAESLIDAITDYEEELEYRQLYGEDKGAENKPTKKPEKAVENTQKKPFHCMTEEEVLELTEEVQKLKDQRTCKVCMDEEVNTVFIKCGHVVCCSNCAPALRHCPVCRETIRGTTRVFLS